MTDLGPWNSGYYQGRQATNLQQQAKDMAGRMSFPPRQETLSVGGRQPDWTMSVPETLRLRPSF